MTRVIKRVLFEQIVPETPFIWDIFINEFVSFLTVYLQNED